MHLARWTRPLAATLYAAALLPLLGAAPDTTVHLAGQLHPAGGGSVQGMQVVVRSGGHADSTLVDARGRFSLRLPAPPAGEPVEVLADARAGLERRFYPSLARVPADSLAGEYSIVLVPLQWTLRSGRFAGTRVDIDVPSAFARVGREQSSFYRYADGPLGGGAAARVPSWPEAAFPLRVAFERGASAGDVTPRDSAAFWQIVDQMETEFGRDLFRPARLAETLPGDRGAPEDVVRVILDPSLRAVGWGSSVSQQGDILYGAIRVRDGRVFSGGDAAALIKHELMHALGVGHTCSWPSMQADVRVCSARRATRLTAEDVAYLQLLLEVRDLQRVLRARQALEAALDGAREWTPLP